MNNGYGYIDKDGNITNRPTEHTTHLGVPMGKIPENGRTLAHEDYLWVEVMVEEFEGCLRVKPLYVDDFLIRSSLGIGQPKKKGD